MIARTGLISFLTTAMIIVASGHAQDFPQDMPLSRVLIEGESWQLISEGHRFTEGPAADINGDVYFSDIPENKIFKIDAQGKVVLFAENTAKTNGLMIGPDALLYGCRMGDRQIVAYDKQGRIARVLAKEVDANDLVVDSTGTIFFTEPKAGRVWHIAPDGASRIVAEDLRPNGLILTPDEGTLVVTDGRDPVLWAFRVEADGALTQKAPYFLPLRMITTRKGTGADGMTFDKAGRIYVATAAGLQMFDPTGRMGGVIAKPQETSMSNVVFGGTDFTYLYVTCKDKVYRRKTKSPGAVYFQHQKP